MGILFLVRHAQASFLEENYDKLSQVGESQARILGEYWAARRMEFDRAGVGPCVRQRDTVGIVSRAFEKAGLKFPEPVILPEFDEYQAEAVLKSGVPELLKTDESVRGLQETFQSSTDAARRATFQRLFEAVVSKWVGGQICLSGVETWADFCGRVNSGIGKVLSGDGHRERVVMFTSGGPIAVAMQRALQLSDERTLQVSWMSRNSSWSEFLYGANRFTLSAFNVHGHIDDPALLTYR